MYKIEVTFRNTKKETVECHEAFEVWAYICALFQPSVPLKSISVDGKVFYKKPCRRKGTKHCVKGSKCEKEK